MTEFYGNSMPKTARKMLKRKSGISFEDSRIFFTTAVRFIYCCTSAKFWEESVLSQNKITTAEFISCKIPVKQMNISKKFWRPYLHISASCKNVNVRSRDFRNNFRRFLISFLYSYKPIIFIIIYV